jgi:hypothetical protein
MERRGMVVGKIVLLIDPEEDLGCILYLGMFDGLAKLKRADYGVDTFPMVTRYI